MRKRSGTSTAARSPPPKRARERVASVSSAKAARKKGKDAKKGKANPEPRLAPSRLKAKPVRERQLENTGAGRASTRSSPDLDDDGLEIVGSDEEPKGSEDDEEREEGKAVETDSEAELGAWRPSCKTKAVSNMSY